MVPCVRLSPVESPRGPALAPPPATPPSPLLARPLVSRLVKLQVTFLYGLVRTVPALQKISPENRFFYQHIIGDVPSLPGVGLLVGLEVVSEGEGEAAVLALEGLLPGVDQLVPLELGVLSEHRGAPGPVTPEDHKTYEY